jgi:hypothetical protein
MSCADVRDRDGDCCWLPAHSGHRSPTNASASCCVLPSTRSFQLTTERSSLGHRTQASSPTFGGPPVGHPKRAGIQHGLEDDHAGVSGKCDERDLS